MNFRQEQKKKKKKRKKVQEAVRNGITVIGVSRAVTV
jgi:preprotein translocase subunit YajC